MKVISKNLNFCGIYMIINLINGKKYIGSSINIRQRLWEHRATLRHNKHYNNHLQRAWNKYGEENFDFSILERCPKEKRFEREQYYVDSLHPEYNICIEIVENPPKDIDSRKKHSETRKKLIKEGIIKITNNTPVYVYYKDGSFVGHWESIRKAATYLKIHYSSACRVIQGIDSQTNGYKFFREKQDNVMPFKKKSNKDKIAKIYCIDYDSIHLEFLGVQEVANFLNTSIRNIRACLHRNSLYKKKYKIYKKTAV